MFPEVVSIVVSEQKPCMISEQSLPRVRINIPIAKIKVNTEITPGNLGSEFHLNLLPPRSAGIRKRVNGIRIFESPILVIKSLRVE